MMYAVVLQNAAEEARLAEYERQQRRQGNQRIAQVRVQNQENEEASDANEDQVNHSGEEDIPEEYEGQSQAQDRNNEGQQQGAPGEPQREPGT